jgi:hypothetical protein
LVLNSNDDDDIELKLSAAVQSKTLFFKCTNFVCRRRRFERHVCV